MRGELMTISSKYGELEAILVESKLLSANLDLENDELAIQLQ